MQNFECAAWLVAATVMKAFQLQSFASPTETSFGERTDRNAKALDRRVHGKRAYPRRDPKVYIR